MTPLILSTQLIYDRYHNKIILQKIRDAVDVDVLNQIYVNHDYDLYKLCRGDELNLYYQKIVALKKTPLIIDCGANNGMSMRYFMETFNHAHVVGVEPDSNNINIAKLNFLNDRGILFKGAIGCKNGNAKIENKSAEYWSFQVSEASDGDIRFYTVNELMENFATYKPFIIKIDIEGYEDNLFKENLEWIDLFPIIVIELHDWMLPRSAKSKNFLSAMAARNRDFIFHGENVFSISNDY